MGLPLYAIPVLLLLLPLQVYLAIIGVINSRLLGNVSDRTEQLNRHRTRTAPWKAALEVAHRSRPTILFVKSHTLHQQFRKSLLTILFFNDLAHKGHFFAALMHLKMQDRQKRGRTSSPKA